MSSRLNEKFFYNYIRLHLFDGTISSKQVQGLSAILNIWNEEYSSSDDRYLAYILGTAHHETGRTFQPIKEWGGNKYFFERYDIAGNNPSIAKRLGNTQKGDGVAFCGRGFVQLTGRSNYTDWGHRLKLDLINSPDLALTMPVAVEILVSGMIKGTFTGKSLRDFFSPTSANWEGARKIVNGNDKAALVASYAQKYYAAISYTL